MNTRKLLEARKEAQAFLRATEMLMGTEEYAESQNRDGGVIYGGRWSASVKRKSMDLTRALADLRKPS